MIDIPFIAIVGRPNVGKSTLFNRISGSRSAIVSDIPGTTRDRITRKILWNERDFILVDTGGLLLLEEQEIWNKVKDQVDEAIAEAASVIMVVDSSDGITSTDIEIAEFLRRTGKPIILCANKAEKKKSQEHVSEFYELSIGEPLPISAYHNKGIDELLDRVVAPLDKRISETEIETSAKIAIVGRPNVGKSTLLNIMLGYERVMVSDTPGTTRDAIDSQLTMNDNVLLITDTAGIRRRGKIQHGIEKYSVIRAILAIERADVVLLVLDSSELVTAQDTHVASYILNAYKGMVIVINKWDLANELGFTEADIIKEVRKRFKFAQYVPIVFTSALKGIGTKDILTTSLGVYEEWRKKISRSKLTGVITSAIADHPPPSYGKRGLKIQRVAQESSCPPTFVFYSNRSDIIHFSYKRYLENVLHKAFGFNGVPLKLVFKGRPKK